MGITIAVLPDPVTQKQIFGEAQWKQLEAIGTVVRNELDGHPER